jgi:AraC family transcriptional regulator
MCVYCEIEATPEEIFAGAASPLFDSGCRRASTTELRYRAVKRAIAMMRKHFHESLTLQDLADAAQMSPFHFNRIFHCMVGVVPRVFLAALRLEHAKQLLLTTQRNITEVCFDVGYKSMGTFTSRFTQFVGMSPSSLRVLAGGSVMSLCLRDFMTLHKLTVDRHESSGGGVTGFVEIQVPFDGLIFIGLFSDPIPQGRPAGCTLLTAPGAYCIPSVPDGSYYLFAAAINWSQDLFTSLIVEADLLGGLTNAPIVVQNGLGCKRVPVILRPPVWADPPIVVAIPMLLTEQVASRATIDV